MKSSLKQAKSSGSSSRLEMPHHLITGFVIGLNPFF
jgi:hypothetical protein